MMRRHLPLLCASLVLGAATVHGAAVTVREPGFGLPHVFGDTDAEMARENGRQIARDRLVQMILLSRAGRGTLYQAFGGLDPSRLNDDIDARQTAYTSSELNAMFGKFPAHEQAVLVEYCKGINDTLDAIYAGASPEPLEINLLRSGVVGLPLDLFGNATNISDQVDPYYAPPGGEWPNSGFQFTPEMVVSIAILEVRNFGLGGFDEATLLTELQRFIAKFGTSAGTEVWSDRNFINDPLAPVTVPDSTTPGYGGPLATGASQTLLAKAARRFPRYDYAAAVAERAAVHAERAAFAASLGAWPMMGSYAWAIAGGKSASGYPWIGGFPQTGIQTPSLMHFVEVRSGEGATHRINGIGMEFAGAGPVVLIGQTDSVAYTTTTAQLPIIDTFLEEIVNESSDTLHYNDEGSTAPLVSRTEIFRGNALAPDRSRVFFRSHDRNGNKGSRAIADFVGDARGTVDPNSDAGKIVDAGAFGPSFVGGVVVLTDGTGAGQIRSIVAADSNTLTVGAPFTTAPVTSGLDISHYAAAKPGNHVMAVAIDSPTWLEETTAAIGFIGQQRAESILDIRSAVRIITSTHNFVAADNKAFNGIGTQIGSGNGNIGYWSSGFSRRRQGGLDKRLPMDGTSATNPLIIASGTVQSAAATSLVAASAAFTGKDFTPPAVNYRYANPTQQGSEYIVAITGGTGYKQTRRIAGNTATALTIEFPWGVLPAPGDSFEVYEILAMPEAINPSEGYMANWNNKAATADPGDNFGRQFRHIFILERLAAENSWDRAKQRQLNKDVAGLDGKGKFGRFLIPRLRQAVNGVGDGGVPSVNTVLAALETHNGSPFFGRNFIDPVNDTVTKGEVVFLNSLVNRLAQDIYADEYSGTGVSVPTGSKALNTVQHAIDSAAGDLSGAYAQAYSGDYFNGTDWRIVVRDSLAALSPGGIPADATRAPCVFMSSSPPCSRYRHPLSALFPTQLEFQPTPFGNRGTYEQIISVGPTVNGEFMFPLGQSGLIQGTLSGITSIDTNVTSLQPLWRDWRFAPMLHVGQDLGPTPDHFMCYKDKTTSGATRFQRVEGESLADEFETGLFDLRKPKAICAPADKNGEGVRDPETHLAGYFLQASAGQPKHVPQVGVTVTDQFGTLTVDTKKPDRLLVPSAKGLDTPPTNAPATNADHYKCYRIKLSQGSAKLARGLQATVADQFGSRVYNIRRASRLCNPVNAGAAVVSPSGHLMCYKATAAKGEARHTPVTGRIILSNDIAADQRVDTIKEEELCVPAITNGVAPTADTDGDGVFDGYERWYYGDLSHGAADDSDGDGATLAEEFATGSDPTDPDTDDDGILDGSDSKPQDRFLP